MSEQKVRVTYPGVEGQPLVPATRVPLMVARGWQVVDETAEPVAKRAAAKPRARKPRAKKTSAADPAAANTDSKPEAVPEPTNKEK